MTERTISPLTSVFTFAGLVVLTLSVLALMARRGLYARLVEHQLAGMAVN